MNSEYVGLNAIEKDYGEKGLLRAQLGLLALAKSFRIYKLLRKEELLLKVALKAKIGEAFELIGKFEKILPKTHYKVESGKSERKKKVDLELQTQIEEIQRKLEEIGGA